MIDNNIPEIVKTTTLIIPDAQYKKIFSYIDACEIEVGGLATIKKINDTTFEVDEVFIAKQMANDAYLRLEDKDILRINTSLSKRIIDKSIADLVALNAKPKISISDIMNYTQSVTAAERNKSKLILQWHSHVDMGTFYSSTDYQTALRLSHGLPYYFMLILNKRHENSCYLMTRSPRGSFEKINTEFNPLIDTAELREQAIKEIKENVVHTSDYVMNETTGILEKKEKADDIKHDERAVKPSIYGTHFYRKPEIRSKNPWRPSFRDEA